MNIMNITGLEIMKKKTKVKKTMTNMSGLENN